MDVALSCCDDPAVAVLILVGLHPFCDRGSPGIGP
jgi:hypothetical protein